MKGQGILMVRAVIANPTDRPSFETWYEKEHLPDAVNTFRPLRAWRSWNRSDPSVHIACYEFENVQQAEAMLHTDGIKALIAEFDRVWGDKVSRTREILDVVDERSPSL